MDVQPENLLKHSTTFQTNDVAEFHSYLASFNGVVEREVDGSGPVELEIRHASLGFVDVGLIHSSVTIVLTTRRQQFDDYVLQFPLTGQIDIRLDDRGYSVLPGEGILISPGVRVRRVGSPGWALSFKLSASLVRSRLEERIGHSLKKKLVFQPLIRSAAKELYNYQLAEQQRSFRGISRFDHCFDRWAIAGSPSRFKLHTGGVDAATSP